MACCSGVSTGPPDLSTALSSRAANSRTTWANSGHFARLARAASVTTMPRSRMRGASGRPGLPLGDRRAWRLLALDTAVRGRLLDAHSDVDDGRPCDGH